MITLPSRLRMGVPAVALGGAPTYVGATSDTDTDGLDTTSITGTQSGDTYIIAFGNDNPFASTTPMVTPSGWSGMNPSWPNENRYASISLVVGYGTTTGTVKTTGLRFVDALSMVAFRNLGTPPSTWATGASGSGNSQTLPSMTVTEEGSTALIVAFMDDDNTTIKSVPSGYTLAVETGSTGGSVAIMYQLDMPVGATGTAAIEWNNFDALVTVGYIIPPPT